jgi:opacity protein-like surface antigen
MKKACLIFVIPILLIFQGVSFSAAPGPYVSGQLGMAFMTDNEMSYGPTHGTMDFKPGFEFSLSGGYNWGIFRLEGEIGYQKNDIDSISGCYEGMLGDVCISDISSSGDVTIFSFLANAYIDFINSTSWTPYITGGIGAAKIEINDLKVDIFPIGDSDDTVLAYQFGAGVTYAFNKNFAIDLKYRYIAMADPEFEGIDAEISIHHVYFGLRYTF